MSRSCADKAEAAANVDENKRQNFPDIPVESITSYSGKCLGASRNKYAENFTGAKSSMCTHAHSLSGWPSGELQEVSPVRVSRCSPLMAPPFSWKWRTESTHQAACWATPLQQLPSPSDKHHRGDMTEGLRCLSLLEPFPHILHSAGDGRRDRPRNVDMPSSTPIIVPPGSC